METISLTDSIFAKLNDEELLLINELYLEMKKYKNIIDELEKDTIDLMKSYKNINAPRYDMCKHFIYKIKELKEKS